MTQSNLSYKPSRLEKLAGFVLAAAISLYIIDWGKDMTASELGSSIAIGAAYTGLNERKHRERYWLRLECQK